MSNEAKIQAVMETLTANVVAAIEAGLANPAGWVAPWHTVLGGAVNAVTGRSYNGGNMLMLAFSGEAGPWATFKQWQSVGANVRKGEHGTPILVPIPVSFKKAKADGEETTVSFTRYRVATVFHAGQVDGWTAPESPVNDAPRFADADAWLEAWAGEVSIVNAPNGAQYSMTTDTITVPRYADFKDAAGFYATVFHEATHSTAHPSRLARPFGRFGDAVYAREELVAELGAAFMGQHFAIPTAMVAHGSDSHADYIANWLQVLRNDSSLLWSAASDAQRAVRMLLAVVPGDGE
jgi:antirestriction protein ArdC